jgi:hypothetical protein
VERDHGPDRAEHDARHLRAVKLTPGDGCRPARDRIGGRDPARGGAIRSGLGSAPRS